MLTLMECADDRYSNLKMYISDLIVDRYLHIPAADVTMHCMI